MTTRADLDRVLPEILDSMGVRALGAETKVHVDVTSDRFMVRLALPARRVDVEIAPEELDADRLFELLENGARVLFHETLQHIAKHDRSPVDRVESLEKYAKALLEVLHISLDDVRMPYGLSAKVQNAAYDLATILKQKPGAVAWARNGYGADPA